MPDATISLASAEVILYPQEDPDAIWYFASPEVQYDPDLRETTLNNIEDGKRTINQETDFTIEAEKVVISSDDNLRGDHILAHILEDDSRLDMQSRNGRSVLINQREGNFEIPQGVYTLGGSTEESTLQNMIISFDLESFTAGGEGTIGITKFEIEDREEP